MTRGGKVRRYEIRNERGETDIEDIPFEPTFAGNIVELEYDDQTGKVTQLKELDENGILQSYLLVYSDSLLGLNKKDGEFYTLTTSSNHQSNFSYLRVRRNERGEIERIYTLIDSRSPITENTPCILLERNDQGLIATLDQSHTGRIPGVEVEINKITYGADGCFHTIENYTANGLPTLNPEGVHRTVLEGQGTACQTISYYDTAGTPTCNSLSFHKLKKQINTDKANHLFFHKHGHTTSKVIRQKPV